MIMATRRIQFCAGHRVANHESKCRNLHGHNYVAFITAKADQLDAIGRVIDFGELKERIGKWIDAYWDHAFIVWAEDKEAKAATNAMLDQKLYQLPSNPTAENMADYLLRTICPSLLDGTGITVIKIVLWETENCFAEVTFDAQG